MFLILLIFSLGFIKPLFDLINFSLPRVDLSICFG